MNSSPIRLMAYLAGVISVLAVATSLRIIWPASIRLFDPDTFLFPILTGLQASTFAIVCLLMRAWFQREESHQNSLRALQTELDDARRHLTEYDRLRADWHDLRNELTLLSAFLQMNQIDRARNFIGRLAKVAGTPVPVPAQAAHFMALTAGKAELAAEKGLPFQLHFTHDGTLLAMPMEVISRILGNLVDNALDAAEPLHGVAVSIYIEGNAGRDVQTPPKQIRMQVANAGPPIPAEFLTRVFERGMSTKHGENRGYGLWIVHSLTESMGGEVRVTSDASSGTAFHVTLPLDPEKSSHRMGISPSPAP